MRQSRVRVTILVYLCVCRHFTDAARAAANGAFGPEEGGPLIADLMPPPALSKQGGIPHYQAKKWLRDIKAKLAKKSMCPVPNGNSQQEACTWFQCKYDFHKTELEKQKKSLEETHLELMGANSEDMLLSTSTIRSRYYKTVKYAILQYDRGCDPQQETIDNLRVWTETIFPERYDCIFEVVDKYLSTHETCDEGFTRIFTHTLRETCQEKTFYENDVKEKTSNEDDVQEKTFYEDDVQTLSQHTIKPNRKPGPIPARRHRVSEDTTMNGNVSGRRKNQPVGLLPVAFLPLSGAGATTAAGGAGGAGAAAGAAGTAVGGGPAGITLAGAGAAGTASISALAIVGWTFFAVVMAGILAVYIAILLCKSLTKKKRMRVSGAVIEKEPLSPLVQTN